MLLLGLKTNNRCYDPPTREGSVMKYLALLMCFFITLQFNFSEASQCQEIAEKLLRVVANTQDFDISDYSLEKDSGSFASEDTEIFYFYNSILDSWKIELHKESCMPINIAFIGDL